MPAASRQRRAKAPFQGQKGRCAWCGTADLPKHRRSWCSSACVDAYRLRADPEYVRKMIHNRDHGICALCGCDADRAYWAWAERRQEVERLANWLERRYPRDPDHVTDWAEVRRFRADLQERYCPGDWTEGRHAGWDADHIVPVVEGGGECGLDNYRTLCHPCHKRVTAELAARRAEQRRTKARHLDGDLFPAT